MFLVDGVNTDKDKYGIIQGNGGAVDKIAGFSTSDRLEGHGFFNQYYGGSGNDTFIFAAKFGQTTSGPTTDFSKQAAYITDFHNAGGTNGSSEHDFIALTGFSADSVLTLEHTGNSGTSGAKLLYYSVHDTHGGPSYNFVVNSLNGHELGKNDLAFYSPTPAHHDTLLV